MRAPHPPKPAPGTALMPVAQRTGHSGKALIVAAVGVILALGVVLGISVLVERGDVELRFGDGILDAGPADRVAAQIERDRAPVLYGSPVQGGRPLYVQHLGDDPEEGWFAFGAFDPAEPDCLVEWSIEDQHFVDQCDDSVTYPPDGDGLRQYEVAARDGRIRVDIQGITSRATTTTTTIAITGTP